MRSRTWAGWSRWLALAAVARWRRHGLRTPPRRRGEQTTTGRPEVEGTVTVLAAASLTDAFGDIGAAFEEANPEADRRAQLRRLLGAARADPRGAPADVFASASGSKMDEVVEAGEAERPADLRPRTSCRSWCRRATRAA